MVNDDFDKPQQRAWKEWSEFIIWLLLKRIHTVIDFDVQNIFTLKYDHNNDIIEHVQGGVITQYIRWSNGRYIRCNERIQSYCTQSVLTAITQRGNLILREVLRQDNTQNEIVIEPSPPLFLRGSKKFIKEDCIIDCVDAAVARKYFSGNWYSDTMKKKIQYELIIQSTIVRISYNQEIPFLRTIKNFLMY